MFFFFSDNRISLLFSAGTYEVGPSHLVQCTQLLHCCWKHLLTSSLQKSANGTYDCFLILLISWNLLRFNANLSFSTRERSKRVPDLRNSRGAGEQSCHYWPEISTETKQSEYGYSCSGAINVWCTTCQVLFAVYHPLDIKCLHWSVHSLFLCSEFMIRNSLQNGKNSHHAFHTRTE